jgi:hypothetical protein
VRQLAADRHLGRQLQRGAGDGLEDVQHGPTLLGGRGGEREGRRGWGEEEEEECERGAHDKGWL